MKLQFAPLCLLMMLISVCLCPARAQEDLDDSAVTISSLPRGAVSNTGSFVVAANGQSFLFNPSAGVDRLPFLKNVYRAFGFSSDARYFLYLKSKGALPTFSLIIYDLIDGSERKLTEDRVLLAAWSPVSQKVALIVMDSGSGFRLLIHNLESGETNRVYNGFLNPEHLEWSGDGLKLLYSVVTPLGDDYFHSGVLDYAVHKYNLTSRSDEEATGEDVRQKGQMSAPILQGQGNIISKVSSAVGMFATFVEKGATDVRRLDEQSGRYVSIGPGHIYSATREGVVVREFASTGVQFRLATSAGIQPLMAFSGSWKLPFQGIGELRQGGELYSGGACDGRACNLQSHFTLLGYALDWQQRPAQGMGPARILAIEAGTVVDVVKNVTCNTHPTCLVGSDDYANPCPNNGGAGNYVVLAHPDGSYSLYVHIRSGTSPVFIGQTVDQGGYLGDQGHSGVTGTAIGKYICNDHIHFQRQISPAIWAQSVPTDFIEVPCALSCGTIYTSQNQETNPPANVTALTLNLIPAALAPGQSSPASRVILTAPAPAPGTTVMLSSSSSDVTVPASVTVPQGLTFASFPLAASATATPSGPITITAQQGAETASAQLTIRTVQLLSIGAAPNPVLGGLPSMGEAVLTDPTPSGETVSVSSSHSNAAVPASTPIPPGGSFATFPIATSLTPVPLTANISATLGTVTETVGLTINPLLLTSIALNASSLAGGKVVFSNRVTLVAGAPAGGAVVSLTSSDSSVASVPTSVTVPEGATIGTFPITTYATSTTTPVTITASFNGSNRSSNLTVNPVGLASLALGTYAVTGGVTVPNSRVTLDAPAGPADVVVTLSSSDPSLITLPASVTVPVGATQSPFFSIPTTAVSTVTNVTITASYNGVNRSVNLRLNPITVNTLSLSSTVVTGGNQLINNRVTLTAAAPPGGSIVTLAASDPAVTLPPNVTVAGGSTISPYFTISTSAVSTQTVATITASLNGIDRTVNLTINPVALTSLTLGAVTAVGGTSVGNNRVTLGGPADMNGAVVTLTSSDPAVAAPPPDVTVQAGATQSPAFVITTSSVSAPTPVTITATYAGVTRTAVLTVGSVALNSLTLGATSIVGGAGFGNNRVNLTGAAGPGGVMVTLSASNSSLVTVPASITVPEGASQSPTFNIATSSVSTPTSVTITASYAGVNRSVNLTLNPAALNSLVLGKTVAVGGTVITNNRVTLNGPAPSGGVAVTLSSSDSALAPVPATIVVSAGATQSPLFDIATGSVSAQTTLAITASYGGIVKSASLTLTPVSLSSLTVPTTVTGGLNVNNCRVLLNGPAGPSGIVVTVSSSDPAIATPPATVAIAPGASQSPPFAIPTSGVTAPTAITITAALNGITRAANLTVNPVIPSSVGLNATAVKGGNFVHSNRVYLNAPAAPGDLVATLTSSDPAIATVPASLTIPAGTSISPPFSIGTNGVSSSTTVIISATVNGVTRSRALTVNP